MGDHAGPEPKVKRAHRVNVVVRVEGELGMKLISSLAILGLLSVTWYALEAHEPVRATGLSGNVKARFIGARRSAGHAANLVARFQSVDQADIIEVVFPAHGFTTQEATLIALVEACSDWGNAPDCSNWSNVRTEMIFSVPKQGINHAGIGTAASSLDMCYLESMKIAEVKR